MPANDPLLIIVVVLLFVIAAVLIRMLFKPTPVRNVSFELTLEKDIDEALARLGAGIKHHATVSAVLALMDQIEEHPDAIERLKEYPETVRAAAWLHYINRLGADLQHAQNRLSAAHQSQTNYAYTDVHKQNAINTAQNHVKDVRAKLDAAIAASGQKVGPRAV
jgi:hypothetical protein